MPSTEPSSRRTALITGASSGIGDAFAHVFAAAGFDLVVTARRRDRLEALADRLQREHGCRVHVIAGDLAQPGAVARLCDQLDARGLTIDALVNNAGYGVPGAYVASPWDRQADCLRVLVLAVAELTHRLLPGMIERGYGRIVNVASLVALMPPPAGLTLYAASKALVIAFSEALGHEVHAHGVHVTALAPGFVETPFHDIARTRGRVRRLPRAAWMEAAAVAQQGYAAVMAGRPLVIPGRGNRIAAWLGRVLPHRLLNYAARHSVRSMDQ